MNIERVTFDEHITAIIITDKPLEQTREKLFHKKIEDLPTNDGYVIIPKDNSKYTEWKTYQYEDKVISFEDEINGHEKASSNTRNFATKIRETYYK